MACSTCPGGNDGRKIIESIRQNRVGITTSSANFVPPPEGQELIFVLYCDGNVAMHNIQSPLRPRRLDGSMVTGYGRRRGAKQSEIEYVENNGGVLTVDQAKEIGALGRSAFYAHPVDIAAAPNRFRIVDQAVILGDAIIGEEDEALGLEDIKGVTKPIAAALMNAGYDTVEALAEANVDDVAILIKPTKRITSLDRATSIIGKAKEALA